MLLDQFKLPGSVPLFHLLLPHNGRSHISVQFVMDKPMDRVSSCESIYHSIPVFPYALTEMARDPDIQRAVPLTGKHIHRWLLI